MVELIQQLLLKHNCVIIPNFGAFIGNYNPAEIRLMDNKILPPNKLIAFNRSLQNNDGLLINAVVHHFSITYHEAEIQVISFAKQCNDALNADKSFIVKEIGRLSLDNDNKIQFQPYFLKNYLADSFGLPEMQLDPIQRLKDSEGVIKETYQRILHPEFMEDAVLPKRNFSKIANWAIAVLTVMFMISSLTWNIHRNNTVHNESSLVPVFKNTPLVVLPKEEIQSATVVIPDIKNEANEITKTELPSSIIQNESTDKSYIAIGVFFDEIRAGKLKAEAESKGFSAVISRDINNGLFRTTVQVENQDVEAALIKVKSELNHRAWVFCVKCNL